MIKKLKTHRLLNVLPVIAAFGLTGAAIYIALDTIKRLEKIDLTFKREDYNGDVD